MKKQMTIFTIWALAAVIQASTIVNWEPGLAWVLARDPDVSSDTEVVYHFSDTTPLIDASSGAGSHGKVYGGFTMTAEGNTSALLRENDSGFLNVNVSGDPTRSLRGVFLWNKEDFAEEGDSLRVEFDADSFMRINIRNFSTTSLRAKFLVKQNDQYYVSLMNMEEAGEFTLEDPGNHQWAPLETEGYTWPNEFEVRDLSDIQAVGVVATATRSQASGQALFNVDGFQVDAWVIPEPATMGLLLMSTTALLAARRWIR